MRRRAVVSGSALSLLSLAGCGRLPTGSSDGGAGAGDGSGTTPAPTGSPGSSTPTGTEQSLEVATFTVDGPVEIGEPVGAAVEVANHTNTERTFTTAVSAQFGGGDWQSTGRTVEVTVPAMKTARTELTLPAHPYVTPATYRLDATGTVAYSSVVGAGLDWGATHELPTGLALRVGRPVLADSYTYPTEDGERTVDPPEGEQWAVYTVGVENAGDEPIEAPLDTEVVLHREDDEFRGEFFDVENAARYRSATLEPGGSVEGELPCDVPADIVVGDLRVEYAATLPDGDVELTWETQ